MYMVGTVRTCCDLAEWHGQRFVRRTVLRNLGFDPRQRSFFFVISTTTKLYSVFVKTSGTDSIL